MHDIYGDEVTFIGVAGRDDPQPMVDFVTDLGVDDFQHAVDTDGAIWQSFGVVSQPAWAFIHDDGRVTTQLGSLGEEGLARQVELLLAT